MITKKNMNFICLDKRGIRGRRKDTTSTNCRENEIMLSAKTPPLPTLVFKTNIEKKENTHLLGNKL